MNVQHIAREHHPGDASDAQIIHEDWEFREFVEMVKLNILQVLNHVPHSPSHRRIQVCLTSLPRSHILLARNVGVQITSFINDFDTSARTKLSRVNQRLFTLERGLDYCEAAIRNSQAQPAVYSTDAA